MKFSQLVAAVKSFISNTSVAGFMISSVLSLYKWQPRYAAIFL